MATVTTPTTWARLRSHFAGDAVVAVAAAALMLVVHALRGFPTLVDSKGDNDSVLRLVQVRDLLDGQGWFDLTQYRMGLEGGFEMHWSRLVDLPIALLVAGFGEPAALVIWPTLLFALALFLIVRSARTLGGDWAVLPAAVIGGLALYFVDLFPPASLDHHNVQLVLALATFLCLVNARIQRHAGVIAGACAALMLAVGMEAAPYVAAACAIAAIGFLVGDDTDVRVARGFGAAFAGVGAASLAATLPAKDWFSVQCDAFSFPQASLAVLGGTGLAAIAATSALAISPRRRLLALAVLGGLAAALLLTAFPQCLADPYADLDPRLQRYWLSAVSEAQSVVSVLGSDPAMFAGFYVTPIIALGVCGWVIVREQAGRVWAVAAAFLGVALLVSFWQVRGAMFSVPLAAIPLAAWVGGLRRRAETTGGLPRQLVMLAGWLVSLNVVWQLAALPLKPAPETSGSGETAALGRCYTLSDYAMLGALPSGLVLAVSNQGSTILSATGHRVLNGPYHRNNAGNLAALDMLMGAPDEAGGTARRLGVDYVVLCRGNPETASLRRWAPEGLLAALFADNAPSWLTSVPGTAGGDLEIWQVHDGL